METTTAVPVIAGRPLSAQARLAANAYLSRYIGITLRSYQLSLDLLFRWLLSNGIDPMEAKRPHIELYVRQHLEIERKNSPASIHHHMTPVMGFYRFAVIDEYTPIIRIKTKT